MKLGLLADIHEQTRQLRTAIAVLQQHGAERFVVLGDVFEMGKRMEETVALLQQVQAVGVWGNHDIGLCFDPDEKVWPPQQNSWASFGSGRAPRR
jgi:predicted phosphodiesterase